MPAAIIPAIGAIAAAASAGTGIYEAVSQPGMPKAASAVTPTVQNAQKAAISQQLPDLQSALGGTVSPDYYLQMAQLAAGTAGQPGSAASGWGAVQNYFGNNAGLTSATGTTSGGLTGGNTLTNKSSGPATDIVSQGINDLMSQFGGGGSPATSFG